MFPSCRLPYRKRHKHRTTLKQQWYLLGCFCIRSRLLTWCYWKEQTKFTCSEWGQMDGSVWNLKGLFVTVIKDCVSSVFTTYLVLHQVLYILSILLCTFCHLILTLILVATVTLIYVWEKWGWGEVCLWWSSCGKPSSVQLASPPSLPLLLPNLNWEMQM